MVEILFPDPVLKKQNWAYLWINSLTYYTGIFIICQVEVYQNILHLSCRPLAFTSYKAFLKGKRDLEPVSLHHLLHDFCRKIFLLLDPNGQIFVNSPSKLHRFWKANPRGNYDIDSTWIFRRGFDFQNRRNIDEFST